MVEANEPPATIDPPKKKNGEVDYAELYEEWKKTNTPKIRFLRLYGLQAFAKKTKGWEARKIEELKADLSTRVTHRWEEIKAWRIEQPKNDFKFVEKVRYHLSLILDQSLTVVTDVHGNRQIGTKLRTRDILRLTDAIEKLQKVQRLALGLSTEHIGIEARLNQGSPNPETAQTDEDADLPVFKVEMNKDGKFTRLRPRKVNE